jgi:hypothetical protein
VAATDGSVNLKKERMGSSFILVDKPGSEALLVLSTPVGGPLASLRAEAVGLLHLLRKAKIRFSCAVPLLIFINCLALLMILKKWGRSDFWPTGSDILRRYLPSAPGTPSMDPATDAGQSQKSLWLPA